MTRTQHPIYQVDAFTDRVFSGNPAAVCPLDTWLPTDLLQSIAAENNLSETAFFVPENAGYRLRWFTPTTEVELCGHATLASAFVVLDILHPDQKTVSFYTKSGELKVEKNGALYEMDLPTWTPQPVKTDPALTEALRSAPLEVWQSKADFWRSTITLNRSAR